MHQLTITHCPQDDINQLSDLLELYGALSVVMTDRFDDPILEPEPGTMPLWPHVVIEALYTPETPMPAIIEMVTTQYPDVQCSVTNVEDQDWERACLDQFKPQCFGRRLWVCPSWHTPPQPNAINLILDPGLAFGTGSHATTALCLTWLDQANLTNKTVIDYGCGSGILSIAALKLGAQHVYAVDIDEQALTATANNATTNAIHDHQLTIGYPRELHTPVDIIIANILLTPLLDLKASFHHLLNHHGLLVLSGILANQVQILQDAYCSHFEIITTEIAHDWALLVLQKQSNRSLLN